MSNQSLKWRHPNLSKPVRLLPTNNLLEHIWKAKNLEDIWSNPLYYITCKQTDPNSYCILSHVATAQGLLLVGGKTWVNVEFSSSGCAGVNTLYSGGESFLDTSCLCDVLSHSKSQSLSLQVQWSLVWPILTHMLHVHSPVQLRTGCFSKVTSLPTYIQRTRTTRIDFFFFFNF